MGEALFKVKQTALKTGSEEFWQYQNILRAVTLSVGEARDVMSGMQGGIAEVCGSLSRIKTRTDKCAENIGNMGNVLEDIAELYGNTEIVLVENKKTYTQAAGIFILAGGVPADLSGAVSTSAGWLGYEFNEENPGITAWIGKAGAEIGDDSAYIRVNGYLGKGEAEVKAESAFMKTETKSKYKNGKWIEKEEIVFFMAETGAEASVSAIAGDVETKVGDDMLGLEGKAEGGAGNAAAGVNGEISVGEDGLNANVEGKAMVSAVEGKAEGTINILGIEITGKIGGYAGAAGLEGKAGIVDNKFVIEGGVAALLGCSAGIEIGLNEEGWDNFIDYISFWD